jgi:pimeloyl-ACP methyl ester carboxylesterase
MGARPLGRQRRRSWFFAVLLTLAFLVGCSQNDAGKPPAASVPEPLVESTPSLEKSVKEVRLETADGLSLRGNLFGQGDTAVILAHMFPADQKSWSEFAKELVDEGDYTVLTFNFRGYGLSEGTKDIAKIDQDMQAALEFMESKADQVFLIGASMGGTAALKVASQMRVAGVATLSAPNEFRGLSATAGLDSIEGAKLFIAARQDGDAPATVRFFYNSVGEPREMELVEGGAHGTDLLVDPPDIVRRLLKNWLAKAR